MPKAPLPEIKWRAYCRIILLILAGVQLLRWSISPQFIDIYYHVLTAWGFIQAGGYTGWDFWQYAPAGRVHIYPPLFHFLLAFFISLGVPKLVLIKILEALLPVWFLFLLYRFISERFSERLAFLALIFTASSFSFFLSLANYLPATLAIVWGLLSLEMMLSRRGLRAVILLALSFYTHIGVSCFFLLAFIAYAWLRREDRQASLTTVAWAAAFSAPVIFKELAALKFISVSGVSKENYFCEFKILDYALALVGLVGVFKARGKYWLFFSFLLASLVFAAYPYRFFSGQGYFPVVILAAVGADFIFERYCAKQAWRKYALLAVLSAYCLYFSPTLFMRPPQGADAKTFGVYYADSALKNNLSGRPNVRPATLMDVFPQKEMLEGARIIQENSSGDDIIFSEVYSVGVALASLSGRATANRLFPEIKAAKAFDPFAVSKIIVFLQDVDPALLWRLQEKYGLSKVGENRLFILYENPSCKQKAGIRQASIPFWLIAAMGMAALFLLARPRKLTAG